MDEHKGLSINTMNNTKGFTLLEVILAIFVIFIGITGALALITFSISGVAINKSRIIASELTQEGMEVVRNIRDTNWLKNVTWDSGLTDDNWRIQYNSQALIVFSDTFIQKNSDGYYGYNGIGGFSGGSNTLFKRKITIDHINTNQIKVISEVAWTERNRSFSVSAENRLYGWK